MQPLSIELEPLAVEVQPLEVSTLDTDIIQTVDAAEIACDISQAEFDAAVLDLLNDPDAQRMLRESEKELDALTANEKEK